VDPQAGQPALLWPMAVYFAAVVLLVVSMVTLSFILGQRHRDRATGEPYESGIATTGSARIRLSAQFYLIAMLFVIFDLEAVFIFAWAVAARELGWPGYIGVLIFIAVLVAGLIYEWRQGALDWATRPQDPKALRAHSVRVTGVGDSHSGRLPRPVDRSERDQQSQKSRRGA
jgi:NADH-quinone oxidoreductase subunit A